MYNDPVYSPKALGMKQCITNYMLIMNDSDFAFMDKPIFFNVQKQLQLPCIPLTATFITT